MRTKLLILFLFPLLVFGQANNSIKAYWRLDGNSTDVSGNTHTGTDATITYSLMNGKFNQGAGFNGTSSQITTATNIGISGNFVCTISFWLKPVNLTSGGAVFLKWGVANGSVLNDCIIWSALAYYGDLVMSFANGQSVSTSAGVFTVNNVWYYVVITKAAGAAKTTTNFYINGVPKGINSGSTTSTPNITNSTVTIGYTTDFGLNQSMNGAMDELIIDNTTWSAAKVSWMYNQYLGIGCADFLRPLYFLYG